MWWWCAIESCITWCCELNYDILKTTDFPCQIYRYACKKVHPIYLEYNGASFIIICIILIVICNRKIWRWQKKFNNMKIVLAKNVDIYDKTIQYTATNLLTGKCSQCK